MEEYCKKQQIVQDRIFTPKIGEIVNATLETQIYSVNFLLNINFINFNRKNYIAYFC